MGSEVRQRGTHKRRGGRKRRSKGVLPDAIRLTREGPKRRGTHAHAVGSAHANTYAKRIRIPKTALVGKSV